MVTVQGEVEKKYVADDGFELPPLTELMAGAKGRRDGGVAPVVEGQPVRQRLEATYFDTADLRLASAGLALRRRTGGDDAGWHLKIPAGSATRSEGPLPRGRAPPGRTPRAVPAQLQAMVWAQTFGAPLQPVARITTERTVHRLADPT